MYESFAVFWIDSGGGITESKDMTLGEFLVVQWLELHASTAGDMGLIPGQGTKILHAVQRGQKKKKKTK